VSDVKGALAHIIDSGKGSLLLIAAAAGHAHVTELAASNGQKRGGGSLDGAYGETCSTSVVLGVDRFACVDPAGGKVLVWDLATRRSTAFSLSVALDKKVKVFGIRASGVDDVVVVETEHGKLGVDVGRSGGAGGEAKIVVRAAGGAVMAAVTKDGGSAVFSAVLNSGTRSLEVTAGGAPVSVPAKFEVAGMAEAELGGVIQGWASIYPRKDGTVGVRLLLATESCELILVQQDKVAWTRTEGLAYVTQARMLDLPVAPPAHDELMDATHLHGSPLLNLVRRVAADLSDLVAFALNPFGVRGARGVRAGGGKRAFWDKTGVSLAHDMEGDRFGFSKIAVLATADGMLFGLHSRGGEVVWRVPISPGRPLGPIFVTRPAGANGQAEVLVLGNMPNGGAYATTVNPLSGAVYARHNWPSHVSVLQAAALPLRDSQHTQLVAMLCTDGAVRVLPDTDEARALITARAHLVVLYLADKERSVIDGYGLLPGGPLRDGVFPAEQIWSVAFPSSERMVALAGQNQDAVVRSAGRVLGDRGVMLKYLNANLLAVATAAAPTKRTKEPVVRVYLIDGVKGAILHTSAHKDAEGPVRMVQSENSLVYSYRNNRKERNEVAVMELFENSNVELKTAAQIMVFNHSAGPQPSTMLEKPRLLTQAYISQAGIKLLAVTETMHGITTKNILMGLSTDQLLSMDRRMLDPRRPVGKPTPQDQEEGLVAFSPYLPVAPTQVLTYNKTIFGLRGITVAPAKIESTCLMLAYGTDIFFTRVAPAKTYDCLGEDFNYPSLILAILVLFTATQAAGWYLARSELNKAWK